MIRDAGQCRRPAAGDFPPQFRTGNISCRAGFTIFLLFSLLGLLVSPAGAVLTMAPVLSVVKVGDVVNLSGINTDNSTTFLFVTGPYLDEDGVMLTNTSGLASGGYFDTAAVGTDYRWSFEWNTSAPEVNLNEGIYIVYAAPSPIPRKYLAPATYAQQTIYFQGSLLPVTAATTPTPTPVPTWTQPPAGTEVQVSSGPSNDFPGPFDGDLIPYEADRGDGNSDIYLYNITSGQTITVSTGPAVRRSPAVSGGTVVYSAYKVYQFNQTDADIFIYNVNTGGTTRLTLPGEQLSPRISGNLVAWQDEAPGRSSVNVVLYDLGTKTSLKVPARTWAYASDISGGKVIWTDDPSGPAVYLYDITGKTVRRVTNKTGIQGIPAISGDRITWADTRNDYAEIYVLDLDTGVETQVTTDQTNHFTPAISGDRVIWVDFRNGNRDIYQYNLATGQESPVTTAPGDQVAPQISGCTVAWADDRNGSYDVYYEKLAGCTPSPTPAPVSLEPEITATPTPVTTSPTPATLPATRAATPASTTPAHPSTAIPTTKTPGFRAISALAILSAFVLIGRRKRLP